MGLIMSAAESAIMAVAQVVLQDVDDSIAYDIIDIPG